jgi:hypothetical protein
VDFRGTTERIAVRILFKVLRADLGTRAMYPSMVFGADLRLLGEPRPADLAFFIRGILQGPFLQVYSLGCHAGRLGAETLSNLLVGGSLGLAENLRAEHFSIGYMIHPKHNYIISLIVIRDRQC